MSHIRTNYLQSLNNHDLLKHVSVINSACILSRQVDSAGIISDL